MDGTFVSKVAILKEQQWRADDGTLMDGATLAMRMQRFGVITSPDALLDAPIGFCLKTGVSAWERIK